MKSNTHRLYPVQGELFPREFGELTNYLALLVVAAPAAATATDELEIPRLRLCLELVVRLCVRLSIRVALPAESHLYCVHLSK